MEQISNKTLTFLLIMAIVVSVGGTIISINRLNQLIPRITGMASTTGTGMVNVSVAGVTSITTIDSNINYGSCSPNIDNGCNATSNTSLTNFNCTCSGGSAPDNITVKNDGNRGVNVTVQTNVLASTFIGGSTPYAAEMWFAVRNSSDNPGCLNATAGSFTPPANFDKTNSSAMQYDWKNFTAAGTEYLACTNLTYGSGTNSFYLFTKLVIPANAPAKTDTNATLTFTATNW